MQLQNRIAKVRKTLAEYLREASDLFDAGEVIKAGQIWQAILKKDPSINEAKSGLLRVREILSGNDRQIQSKSVTTGVQPLSETSAEDIEGYLREGCSLYDKGELHEALNAWEKVLAIDPLHYNALSYVRGVRKELGLAMPDINAITASNKPPSDRSQELAILLERGSELYEMGMFEDAVRVWKSALAIEPDSSLTKGYLAMVQKDMEARSNAAQSSSLSSSVEPIQAPVEQGPVMPVEKTEQKPVSVERNAQSPVNRPIALPAQEPQTKMPWVITQKPGLEWHEQESAENKKRASILNLHKSRFLRIAVAVVLLLGAGAAWLSSVKKDALLNAMQAAIREEAIKSAQQSNSLDDLTLTPAELKSQAKAAMSHSPLRAYLLAQEVINRDTLDTTAARLLEQAQQAMIALPLPSASDGNFNRLMSAGNFEAAEALMEVRLRQSPNDIRAREDLARVSLLMVRGFVKQDKWDSARSRLLMGAALFPKDPTWQARLKLLEHLQSMPKEEKNRWIDLLG